MYGYDEHGSAGWAARPSGDCSPNVSTFSSGIVAGISGVHTGPGATELTLMPFSLRSLLFSADLAKRADVHETCYNDPPGGHTAFADFRLNHLTHLNRRFDADFVLDRFVPRAHYDPATRVVVGLLHVVEDHEARIGALDVELRLRAGDAINVGFSARFDRGELEAEAREHGLLLEADWTDPEWHYGLFLARRK